ncbi:MAG: universal stress protein [Alphaproteobacteria bacterium]|nr:universal stress protein [Alphaproteobacteria bacterium]MBV9693481.1 universal stress protein [Alphaproteobacteria bacterium]
MSIAKIVVPVTGSSRDDTALATAFTAARPFAAHVEALFVATDPREVVPYSEMPLPPDLVQEMVDAAADLNKKAAKVAQGNFAAAAKAADVRITAGVQKGAGVTASLREATGHLAQILGDAALLADLIVLPPLTQGDRADAQQAFVRVLTGVERPVLLSPAQPPSKSFARIAIGWDGGRAAAHALSAALPFLEKAQRVELLSIAHLPDKPARIAAAKDYLLLHGIGCTERLVEAGTRDVADVLLDACAQCDLLVVGGYGTSRLIETIFGGVTRSIVSQPNLPVFMVH